MFVNLNQEIRIENLRGDAKLLIEVELALDVHNRGVSDILRLGHAVLGINFLILKY